MKWQLIRTLPEGFKDGRKLLLHVDWQPLTIIGYFGPNDQTESQYDDHGPTWRVHWDGSRIDSGFDEPTHWCPLPDDVKKAGQPIYTAPLDGTKIDLWLEIPSSARSMGWADQFWVTNCWWQNKCWVHRHHGKDAVLDRDYIERWLPAGAEKPVGDDVHHAEP